MIRFSEAFWACWLQDPGDSSASAEPLACRRHSFAPRQAPLWWVFMVVVQEGPQSPILSSPLYLMGH